MVLSKMKNMMKAPKRRNLIAFTQPDSKISEQYRSIWANLKYIKRGAGSHRILITSPSMNQGKSTTAANLAVTMSLQKERVLLIDGNLRSPSLHYIFKLPNTRGLTDILNGAMTFEETIYPSKIGKLDILTSGSVLENPVELIESEQMDSLLKMAESQYDMIIMDSPSILDITETKLLANKCDGVIIVVKNSKTNTEAALTARIALERVNANIVGLVINS
ncbi:CpsD/CapB family tyrosine-protein kinase [Peribacillus kribbensis]|uniref:CpsD/CapB family tyrosine-protein kinase n=1 Tax=Peribacillus kribbensis TaxID=356658 RepID=UPI000407907A|nr:CpsD/CapB family tyrosine-protein kinase [Peribacillus kribbensis]